MRQLTLTWEEALGKALSSEEQGQWRRCSSPWSKRIFQLKDYDVSSNCCRVFRWMLIHVVLNDWMRCLMWFPPLFPILLFDPSGFWLRTVLRHSSIYFLSFTMAWFTLQHFTIVVLNNSHLGEQFFPLCAATLQMVKDVEVEHSWLCCNFNGVWTKLSH